MGGTLAFTNEHLRERRWQNRQAFLVLRALSRELRENLKVMQRVLPHFEQTPYGKSFYLHTSVWETALETERLPEVIGFELADTIAFHYSILERLRYYGDLLVRVWLADSGVEGYDVIRSGFRKIIIDSLNEALAHHPQVLDEIDAHLERLGKPRGTRRISRQGVQVARTQD